MNNNNPCGTISQGRRSCSAVNAEDGAAGQEHCTGYFCSWKRWSCDGGFVGAGIGGAVEDVAVGCNIVVVVGGGGSGGAGTGCADCAAGRKVVVGAG